MYSTELMPLLRTAIELNDKIRLSRLSMLSNMRAIDFAKKFATIKLDIGRQTGKTTSIVLLAKDGDAIITHNMANADHVRALLSTLRPSAKIDVYSSLANVGVMGSSNPTRTVWINDANYNKDIDLVYNVFAHDTKQFVLIG